MLFTFFQFYDAYMTIIFTPNGYRDINIDNLPSKYALHCRINSFISFKFFSV